ncbi:hypothetical protein QBC40DRAFT_271730 [Triangularia verruculosa]|uniref:F-box domain-containing protein n=1 Tax=Triangularia verruculosa TaxID=2587418 RepID=A0AAN7B0A9_9PEZI|nr:hypothetical protein QBC40DRAFT_271730 [Triangularia verruculosa]
MKSFFASRRKLPSERHDHLRAASLASQDLLTHLPTELIIIILEQLDTSTDIVSALNACRTWRDILLSPEIWPKIADRLTPGLASHIRATASSADTQGKAFQTALTLHHLHQTGTFTHVNHQVIRINLENNRDNFFTISKQLPVASGGVHSVFDVPGLDPTEEDEHVSHIRLYSHGRVAWWPEAWSLPFFAVVDDFRSRTRRMYLFPGQDERNEDRRRGWKASLGESLFVLGQEDAGVCVWHLERDELKMVALPGAFDRCVVHGERLLFVGRNHAEVWLWDWEAAAVKTVDVAGYGCYQPGPVRMGGQAVLGYPRPAPKWGLRFSASDVKLDFILHPTEKDVFFVVTWDEQDLVVSEFVSEEMTGRIVCSQDCLAYRCMLRSRTDNAVHYLRTDRCDGHGGYVLTTAWVGTEPICDAPCEQRGSIVSVCFNVYSKTFSTFVHHASDQRTPAAHLWDGLLSIRIAVEDQHGLKPAVALMKPCPVHDVHAPTLQEGDLMQVRLIKQPAIGATPAEASMAFVPSGSDELWPRAQTLCNVAYALEAGGDATPAGSDVMKAEWFDGDERTLVYVAGRDYTVWVFGEEVHKQDQKDGRVWRDRLKSVMSGAKRRNPKP